ncbi:MAG TPA: hypothetical protein PKD55_06615 [Bellilinea sp.]|nr:hypothetical protein [Bellilinea sp.]
MTTLVYQKVRSLLEKLGGTMDFLREGYPHGAWNLTLNGKQKIIEASGNRSFPELDHLYIPKIRKPKHWEDYLNELAPDAEARLMSYFGLSKMSAEQEEKVETAIGRSRWKFAWTYARTYPHEYTKKDMSTEEDHALIIESIEQFGVIESFGKFSNKYLRVGERKYWHMGDPYSSDPAEQPNIINRTWLDVKRHAENVKHRWTPEEVELQTRIWEIQLEKKSQGS